VAGANPPKDQLFRFCGEPQITVEGAYSDEGWDVNFKRSLNADAML
jgi:hypothetical protein